MGKARTTIEKARTIIGKAWQSKENDRKSNENHRITIGSARKP